MRLQEIRGRSATPSGAPRKRAISSFSKWRFPMDRLLPCGCACAAGMRRKSAAPIAPQMKRSSAAVPRFFRLLPEKFRNRKPVERFFEAGTTCKTWEK